MKTAIALLAILIALAPVALAHDGHVHHVLGTVQSVEGDNAVIELKDGKKHTVTFSAQTRFTKGKATATRDDVRPGVRVSIDLADDSRTARTVKIGAASK